LSGEGKPKQIRSDNGPEYISSVLATWAEKHGVELKFIQPGNPQQNAYVERYNRTVRYDWLNQYLFSSIAEVQNMRQNGYGFTTMNDRTKQMVAYHQSKSWL
jgi:transposase InsO family protein